MTLQTEIQAAIGVHSLWKTRLKAAIETGSSEYSPDKVRTDNQCDFGKWLHALPKTAPVSSDVRYLALVKQHAEFHRAAAEVLRLALQGNKPEARKELGPGSRFASLSLDLTRALMEWHKSAK